MKITKVIGIVVSSFLFATSALALTSGDDFNDNKKSNKKWGSDKVYGHGRMLVKNQRLQYECKRPTKDDDLIRPWKKKLPYNSDWTVQLDIYNTTDPIESNQVNSFGVKVRNNRHKNDELYAELYASHLGLGQGSGWKGFYSELFKDDNTVGNASPSDIIDVSNGGAVRMVFNSTSKVITVFYDEDPSNDYTWTPYGSFGIAGSGGTSASTDWVMTEKDSFEITVYGFSANMKVSSGQMTADNFSIILP